MPRYVAFRLLHPTRPGLRTFARSAARNSSVPISDRTRSVVLPVNARICCDNCHGELNPACNATSLIDRPGSRRNTYARSNRADTTNDFGGRFVHGPASIKFHVQEGDFSYTAASGGQTTVYAAVGRETNGVFFP